MKWGEVILRKRGGASRIARSLVSGTKDTFLNPQGLWEGSNIACKMKGAT